MGFSLLIYRDVSSAHMKLLLFKVCVAYIVLALEDFVLIFFS